MIYKTLHWYIFRELLRIFFLTAGALTTMLAFGGTFKPLTKEGLELGQLMFVLINLMPAMLAYAIPMSALFAAVLVYWRLATDNEIMACRAGGVSFWTVLFPALILGLAVASVDLGFMNYVVPMFLQRTEVSMRRDLGSLLINKVGRQEPFQVNGLVVYADSGQAIPTTDIPPDVEERTIVRLTGMAATKLNKDNKPEAIIIARVANVIIDQMRNKDEVQVRGQLEDGAVFEPNTFRKVSGTARALTPDGKPYLLPSGLLNKPKFLDRTQLLRLNENPERFGQVGDISESINKVWRRQQLAARLLQQFKPNRPLVFDQGNGETTSIEAPHADLNADKELFLSATSAGKVKVDLYRNGTKYCRYTCEQLGVFAAESELEDTAPGGEPPVDVALTLQTNVLKEDLKRNIITPAEKIVELNGMKAAPGLLANIESFPTPLLREHPEQFSMSLQKLGAEKKSRINKLIQAIGSELHSRGSFALSCLTLVLLGASLGILMRGQNPLFVFVVGFVPAIVLVLLITAGRRMVENSASGHTTPGFAVIWAGNIILLGLVFAVYTKLLRQ